MSLTPENPFESLENVLSFNARDWSTDRADAWLWGIICGWDEISLKELVIQHKWDAITVARLRRLRSNFVDAQIEYAKKG